MIEERFLSYEQMADISRDLHASGFEHVIVTHLVDPKWRKDYRPGWADERDVMWSVRLHEYLMPMERTQELIDICKRHGLVFWVKAEFSDADDDTGGTQFYARIAKPNAVVANRL